MSKNNDNARSIDLGEESDGLEDLTESELQKRRDARREEDEVKEKVSYWNISQQTKDHAVQMVLKLSGNLGSNIGGKFHKGVFARKNVDGIREYISHKDDKKTREIMILVSTLNVMSSYIVPLFECSGDDTEVITPLLKLFLALTKGLSGEKRDSVVTRVKEKPLTNESKEDFLKRVQKAKSVQKNSYQQISALMSFKEAIVSEQVFKIVYDYVDGPISKTAKVRTADDLKRIETFLFLVSNLLQIQAGPFSLSSEQIHSRSLQNKLILILKKEHILELFMSLCTSINKPGHQQWNGLIMEILHHLFW
jgi:hypothetical protein